MTSDAPGPEAKGEAPEPAHHAHRVVIEAALVAAVPASGYLLAYLYEWGFCKYFRIPSDFISAGVTQIVFNSLAVALIVGIMVAAGEATWRLRLWRHPIATAVVRVLIFVPPGLPMLVVLGPRAPVVALVIAPGVLSLVYYLLVRPLRKYSSVRGYGAKLRQQAHDESERLRGVRPRPALAKSAAFILMALVIAPAVGILDAQKQVDYLVEASSNPPTVVLRVYGGAVISAPFDRASRRVKREFHFWKLDEMKPLRLEPVGPLEIAK